MPRASKSKPSGKTNAPPHQKRAQNPNKKPKPNKHIVPPRDKLVDFVEHFLGFWQNEYPNPKFYHDLLNFMMPLRELDQKQLDAVLADFTAAIGQQVDFFRYHPFGSTVTGLAFRDSDFDVFVETNVPKDKLPQFLMDLRKIMRKQGRWGLVTPIVSARVPLMKAAHGFTGRQCDFSFPAHKYSVHNTQLIIHLVARDPRIRPLTMLLKYWFRVNGIGGTGKFTSFALFMMIVFYLQVIPNPILPPLLNFQRNVPPLLVEDWNVALDFNLKFRTTNTSSVLRLIYGFFEYYNKFDFENHLISPLMGRTYNRKYLHDKPPAEMSRYFRHLEREPKDKLNLEHSICVQDPHRLNINLTNCTMISFLSFKQHLSTMCQHIELAKSKSVDLEKVGLLSELFAMRVTPIAKGARNRNADAMAIEPTEAELKAAKLSLGGEPDDKSIMAHWKDLVVVFFKEILPLTVLNVVEKPANVSPATKNAIVLCQFIASIDFADKPKNGVDEEPLIPTYRTAVLDRHLENLKKLLLAEKKEQIGLQFEITLSTTAGQSSNSITVIVHSPRCGKTNVSKAVKGQFEQLRSFFWSKDGIRMVLTKLFSMLNDV